MIVKEDLVDGEPDCCGLNDTDINYLFDLLTEGRNG